MCECLRVCFVKWKEKTVTRTVKLIKYKQVRYFKVENDRLKEK